MDPVHPSKEEEGAQFSPKDHQQIATLGPLSFLIWHNKILWPHWGPVMESESIPTLVIGIVKIHRIHLFQNLLDSWGLLGIDKVESNNCMLNFSWFCQQTHSFVMVPCSIGASGSLNLPAALSTMPPLMRTSFPLLPCTAPWVLQDYSMKEKRSSAWCLRLKPNNLITDLPERPKPRMSKAKTWRFLINAWMLYENDRR